eukprot:6705173-Ditylum_brightwellii.AAC.1
MKDRTKQTDIRDRWGLQMKRRKRPHCTIQIISTDENESDMEIGTYEQGWEQDNKTLDTQEEAEMTKHRFK